MSCEEDKIREIWLWMGQEDTFNEGVSNTEVLDKFGKDYQDAWKKVKSRYNVENGLFYENKRWYRWSRNYSAK